MIRYGSDEDEVKSYIRILICSVQESQTTMLSPDYPTDFTLVYSPPLSPDPKSSPPTSESGPDLKISTNNEIMARHTTQTQKPTLEQINEGRGRSKIIVRGIPKHL